MLMDFSIQYNVDKRLPHLWKTILIKYLDLRDCRYKKDIQTFQYDVWKTPWSNSVFNVPKITTGTTIMIFCVHFIQFL